MASLHTQFRAQAPATASKTAKSVIRPTSTIKRKIDNTDFDEDLLPADSNPIKKPRVTFNPDVEKREIVEYAAKGRSLDTIRAEIRKALDGHAKGDIEGYGTVRAVFSTKREYDDEEEEEQEDEDEDEVEKRLEIRTYVIALTGYASHLDKSCSTLVNDILHCEWMGRDEGFIKAYIHFLGSLASAQGAYVGKVLEMLVGYFAGVRFSSGRLPGYPDVKRDQLSSRVHSALKYLLRLIPSASGILSPIMSKKFPDSEESKKAHVNYIQNLFRLMEYAPELKSDIFALVTEKLVDIDVQMQVRLDEEDEIATAVMKAITMSGKAAIEAGGDDTDSDGDSVSSDDDDSSDSKRIQHAQSHVEKMDAMLDILFTMYDTYFLDNPISDEAIPTFEMLLSHFANIILPTCQSRHTQFLLFHFAQRHTHLVDQFAGTCVQLAFESGRPAVLRNSAAAYLASFVSRGKHVEDHVVVTVFELIGSHLERIRVENERTCRGPDLKRYGTFYAMTQALLYIFCFRWRDLLLNEIDEDDPDVFSDPGGLKWMPGIKDTLSHVIHSALNPLKVCSQPIVMEFAKIARHLGFMYVYSILETNRRIRLSQFALGAGSGALRDVGSASNESWHQLEAHFPFDPYVLPKSRRWVDGDYRQWQSIPGLEPEEESDSDDDSGEEEEVKIVIKDDDTSTDDDNA